MSPEEGRDRMAAATQLIVIGPVQGQFRNNSKGASLLAQQCDRGYRNEVFGFGFTPPDGNRGPDVAPASKDPKTLFVGTWTSPNGREYRVTVFNIGTTTFDDALKSVRSYNGIQGL